MINYVNNAYDKVLKPCDAQRFSIIINSQETEKYILGHRGGDAKAKSKLPALTYMGVLDSEKYRKYLDQCKEQGTKPQGSRRAEFMRPTGLLMLDFDHVPNPQALYEQLAAKMDRTKLALAHITPSGQGLRLVLQRTKGMSIEQEQYEWCKAMGVKCDDVCKDISRLSFAPMKREILYFNPSLLFGELPEAGDYPDGSLFSGVAGVQTNASTMDNGYPLRTSCSSPLKGDSAESAGGAASKSNQKELSPFKGRSEAFGGLPKWQSVPSEGSAVPCATEADRERNGAKANGAEGVTEYPTSYEGVDYATIVARLEEQLGGRPEHGARNSFIFSMACNLRYICNDDPQWIAAILPTYGEDAQKHRMTIQSAVNRPMSREMPETMARALRVASLLSEPSENSETSEKRRNAPPSLPAALPPLMELLTSRSPEAMRPAVAMSVFPPLGAHLQGVKLTYWDGRDYEPAFMQVVAAEMSVGKSAVNLPIDYIIADIEARDDVARHKDAEWKERCATLKSTEDKPTRPKGLAVQVLSADMTNAAFVQRLADAEGKFLYTQMDEIELLDSLKANTRGGAVSAILRLAFDCGKYGQERVASNAINAKVRVRWNWNASTTIQRVRKYFAHSIADGTLSRLSFATIIKDDDDWGEQRPRFSAYGKPFADALAPYIDRLTTCTGTLHCPEAIAWAEQMCDEQIAYAREMDDRAYAQYSYRSVLMGFYRAMVLYIAGGMQWTDEIARFAAWSVRYDMWCKMRFFRDMMHKDMEGERTAVQRGPASLLALLPHEFTREQVREVRRAQGMQPNPKNMLAQWVYRGFVQHDEERGVYVKLKVEN